MRRRISALLLSAVMVVSTFASGGVKEVSAAETAKLYEYQEVSVKNPVTNSWHVTESTSGDGSADWAFDNNSATHWHTNYTADVTDANGTVTNRKVEGVDGVFGTVDKVPEKFSEVEDTRVWIGGEFETSIELSKIEYTGRVNKNANWPGQYAVYAANVSEGTAPSAADYTLVANGVNTAYSTFTIQLEQPVEATHFKIVTFSVIGGNNNMSASEIDIYEAVEMDATPRFGGSIVDTDTQYTQDRLLEVSKLDKSSETLTAWKNDKALSEIALYAISMEGKNVSVTTSDLTDGKGHTISKNHVTTTFIKSTKAYNGAFLGYGNANREVPEDNGTNRSESSDILYQTTPIDMKSNTVQPVWVEFEIPEDAEAGTYTGTITVKADGLTEALEFQYKVNVQDAVLPDAEDFKDSFDMMQWQYPYSSAEYYNVTPFSDDHLEILRSGMQLYKEVGGNAITATFTEEAWSGQTYSKNDVHYPSMVTWTKSGDTITYDYTDLDLWIGLCKEMGLGDKIVFYGIAPWHGSFTYWEDDQLKYETYTAGNERYVAVWTDFLTNLAVHLKEKGWFESAYIGIDERGISASAFDVAEKAGFKTAADIDNITNHWEIAQRVTDLNVGDTAAQKNAAKFAELLEIREAKGYKTTLYSCTEHQPGQFSLSAPVESYWAVIHAGKMGADGFNRWAFDAWVEDPLNDATHNAFEPGDCFVIYPDEKTSEDPEAKSSVRLERMAEGIRDVNKLKLIAEEVPYLSSSVDEVFAKIQYQLKTNRNSYMSDAEVESLASETASFKEALNDLTEKYIVLKNGGIADVDDSKKVAYYSFDQVEGTTLKNEWSDQYNGTVNESADYVEGKQGKALSVNTSGEGAVLTDAMDSFDSVDWTVGYWVKASSTFDQEISVLEDSTKAYSLSLRLGANANRSKGGFRVGDNDGDVLTYNYDFEAGKWYHLTWVQEKSSGLSLYVNGEFVQKNTWTATNAIKAPLEVIGGTGFTGLIDEVKIYNTVLTADEISASMQVEGINLAESEKEISMDDSYQIQAFLVSGNADQTFTYSSADPKVATVDENGLVKAVGCGTTTITVKNEATGYTAIMTITVKISIINKLTKYTLPEKYQSNVEGAASTEEGTLVGTSRQYLGQPDMIRTRTGRLITVFPEGHGHGPLVMKYSEDNGDSWYEVETPKSWDDSQETPTLYTLDMEDGHERLILICACPGSWGNYTTGWDYAYSDDNGENWSEFTKYWSTFGDGTKNDVIVGMASLVQLKDSNGDPIQKWMGVYHDFDYVNYKTYLTFDENGDAQWTEPVAYLSDYRAVELSHQICEVGMFRSPDGKRIVALARNQTHTGPATMFWSDDEGETWTEPVELPGSLAGERHKALYDPVTGKLVITFREIDYDRNKNGVWEGGSDWIAGEWVAWVGTYEDLINLRQGEYMLVLDEDFANNYYSGDTGYTGMVVLEDGTFIMDSYGHWDQEYSSNYKENGSYNVKTDLCWIRQAKFNLYELELELGIRTEEKQEAVRVFGDDRNATSLKVADQLKAALGIEKFDTIIVATGKNYADALTGSYLAKVKNAPILLTNGKEATNSAMLAYIKANASANATIYILGQTATVSAETEALLKGSYANVKRLGGETRLATNIEILKEVGLTGQTDLLIATSNSFADSLSAAATGKPILLVNSKKGLNADQKAILTQFKDGNIYVLGGISAVYESAVEEVAEAAGKTAADVEAKRLAGENRFATSVMIAETFFADATKAVVACGSGDNYPDGLCGGPLAAALNAPLILTKDGDAQAAAYTAKAGIKSGYVLGGTNGLVSDDSAKAIFSADEIISEAK